NLDQHIGAPRRVDLEQRVQAGPKAPDPLPETILLVTGLVDIEPILIRQTLQQVLIGLLQRLAHLGDDVRQLPARDGQTDDVANEFADGGERSVADPFEVGDHGGQPGPHQAAAFDADGQRGLIDLLAARAPPRVTAMLLDHKRHVLDVDLLDHPGHDREHGLQVMPTPWANIEAMVERIAVDQFRREGGAFVLGVTRLPAAAASLLALRRGWFGRLDDVRRRWLGRGRGILPRRSELLMETSDSGLERLQLRLLGVQLRLQAPTVRAKLPCLGSHDGLCYILGREYTTPVNGYMLSTSQSRGRKSRTCRAVSLRPAELLYRCPENATVH